jgi:hypothetical protein
LLILAVMASYLLGGFAGVPLVARHLVLPRINDRLNGAVVVERIACNPIRMNLRLTGVEVQDASGKSVAGFGSFIGDLRFWATVLRSGIHFQQVEVFDFHGSAQVDADGRLDLASLLKPASASITQRKPVTALPRLVVEKLGGERGRLTLTDLARSEPFELELHDINLRADHFDTDPAHTNNLSMSARTPGEDRFSGSGSVRFDPLTIAMSVDALGFELSRFQPYLGQALSSRLGSGVSSATLTLDLAPLSQPYRALVGLERVRVDDIDVTFDDEPLAKVSQITIESIRADLLERTLAVGPVELRGVAARVERRADGTLRVGDVLRPIELPGVIARDDSIEDLIKRIINAVQAMVTSALGPWELDARRVTLADTTITFVDSAPATPVTVELTELALRAGPVASRDGFDAPVELSARVGRGLVKLQGRVRAQPMLAQLDVEASSIDLAMLSAYVPMTFDAPLPARASVDSGLLDATGKLAVSIEGQTVNATWDGRAGLRTLAVEPLAHAQEIVAAGQASLVHDPSQPIRASYAGMVEGSDVRIAIPDLYSIEASVGGVSIDGLRVALPLESVEASSVVLRAPTVSLVYPVISAPTPEAPAEQVRAYTIEIPTALKVGKVEIIEGKAMLADSQADPPVNAMVDELAMTLSPIDTAASVTSTLALSGRVQSTGRFEVDGSLDPLKPLRQTDLRIALLGVPIKPFEAATGRYLGHLVEGGRLRVDFPVRIDAGNLDGRLEANLDRFYLGTRVESPDALKLPIKLGLDLLRDPQEQIDLSLHITGDIKDSRFSVLGLVWQAVGNLMSKAVTAPFQLLASAMGAQDRDISRVSFGPGGHDLSPEAVATLDVVARALNRRPGLTLVIRPSVVESDLLALKLDALRSELLEEARRLDASVQQLDDLGFAAMIKARYEAIIPPTADAPAAGEAQMLDAMLQTIDLPPEWVQQLRDARARAVIDTLVNDGSIDPSRVVVEVVEDQQEPGVTFDLR